MNNLVQVILKINLFLMKNILTSAMHNLNDNKQCNVMLNNMLTIQRNIINDLRQMNNFREDDHCERNKRLKRETYDLISKTDGSSYKEFDKYLKLSGPQLMKEIENELENAFDKNLNVSITKALQEQAEGDLSLLKNKTYFLNTYNDFKKSYCSKLEHWYIGITLYLPMKMKEVAKEKYFLIVKNTLPEKEQMEKFWEYERDLDYQFNIFAKKLRDYLQVHYVKLEKTFHRTFTQSTNSTLDLSLFKIVRRQVEQSTLHYETSTYLTM